jgi:hypothetical protein
MCRAFAATTLSARLRAPTTLFCCSGAQFTCFTSTKVQKLTLQSIRGDDSVGTTRGRQQLYSAAQFTCFTSTKVQILTESGPNDSILLLSASGELATIDNLKGHEVKREHMPSEGPFPFTCCHVSGALLSVGSLSGGISLFNHTSRKLSPLCRLLLDPSSQRNVVGHDHASEHHKHLADGITVVLTQYPIYYRYST